ncbi:MAG: CDP-alcohol phosphatidyltransferase family protein [Chloroflexota bacterium]
MSWPHFLSFSRVLAGPIIAALVLSGSGDGDLLAAILFGLASFTDMVDGKLARYSQRVSPLGVFLDTTSDKVLVGLALIAMAIAGHAAAWIPLVIVGREFLISGLRSYAATLSQVISAHIWGKGKAAVTMVAIGCVLTAAGGRDGGFIHGIASHAQWNASYAASQWLLGLSAILTIISGARYLVDARPLFGAHVTMGTPDTRKEGLSRGIRKSDKDIRSI